MTALFLLVVALFCGWWALRALGTTEVVLLLMGFGAVVCLGILGREATSTVVVIAMGVAAAGFAGLWGLGWRRSSEKSLLAELFPQDVGEVRVGDQAVGGRVVPVRVSVERGARTGPKRFFDDRVVVLSVRVPDETLTLERRSLLGGAWPAPPDTVGTRYFLDAPVREAIARVPDCRIREGKLEIARGKWCTRERIAAWLEELGTVLEPLSTVEERVAARLSTELDPRMQRYDWQGLTTWASARARAIAPSIPANADPAVVVGAAALRGDTAMLEALLRTTSHPEALIELADWAQATKRADLAPLLAARLGVPPAEAWPSIVRALRDLGGREEMPILHEVAGGAGYSAGVRTLAWGAIFAIRGRLGEQHAGAVALAGASGEVSVVDGAGAVSPAPYSDTPK